MKQRHIAFLHFSCTLPAPATWQPIRGNLASSELIAPIDGRLQREGSSFDKICSLMESMSPMPWNGC